MLANQVTGNTGLTLELLSPLSTHSQLGNMRLLLEVLSTICYLVDFSLSHLFYLLDLIRVRLQDVLGIDHILTTLHKHRFCLALSLADPRVDDFVIVIHAAHHTGSLRGILALE